MSDGLTRARLELMQAQRCLALSRSLSQRTHALVLAPNTTIAASITRRATDRVLAALSWVWDEQERKRETDWSKMTQAEIFEDLSRLLPFAGPVSPDRKRFAQFSEHD